MLIAEHDINRVVGGLAEAVGGLKTQVAALASGLESNRRDQRAEWESHRASLEDLRHTTSAINAAQKSLSGDVLLEAARVARECVAAEAATARDTIRIAAIDRRAQGHWIIDKCLQALPVVYAATVLLLGYLVIGK